MKTIKLRAIGDERRVWNSDLSEMNEEYGTQKAYPSKGTIPKQLKHQEIKHKQISY